MTTNPQELGFIPGRLARIEQVLQQYIDQGKLAGSVTLVARHGQLAHLCALGHAVLDPADPGGNRPMQTDTIFRIYSMTKPVTAAAVMALFEEGRFRLTDQISEYIPVFKKVRVLDPSPQACGNTVPPNREITIYDLLTHTAGLSYGFEEHNVLDQMYRDRIYRKMEARNGDVTLEEFVQDIASIPLAFHPGTAYHYSVANDVLGYLVEVVSGQPFAGFLRERIFEPLGMVDTGFYVPAEKRGRFQPVYTPAEGGGLKIDMPLDFPQFMHPPKAPQGGGGLVSTAADYWRFAQMLLNQGALDGTRILGRKTVELMTTNALPAGVLRDGNPYSGYGLGVEVIQGLSPTIGLGSVGNFGWSGAATTHFWVDPKEDLIGILLVQIFPFDAMPVRRDFQNLVYQALE